MQLMKFIIIFGRFGLDSDPDPNSNPDPIRNTALH